jgi:hypothetical protein
MTTAMERADLPADVSQKIMRHFAQVAAMLVNR